MTIKKIKRIRGYSALSRYLSDVGMNSCGQIPATIQGAYSYSREHLLFPKGEKKIFWIEAKHRVFDVYEAIKGES